MSIILKDDRLFMPSSSDHLIAITAGSLAIVLWLWVAGYRRRKKKKWTVLTLDDTTEVLREWFWEIPKEWITKIYQEAKHIWSRLHPHNKKAIAGILLIMLLWLGYGILTKDSKKDNSEHVPEQPKFPNRKPEMGLDKFKMCNTWQIDIANPYYEKHKNEIQIVNTIEESKNIKWLIKLDTTQIEEYYSVDNMIAQANYAAEHTLQHEGRELTKEEKEKYIETSWKTYLKQITHAQACEFIYTHEKVRAYLQELSKEFNKRLKEAGYDKTLWLEINGMYRTKNAQQCTEDKI